MLTLWLGQYHKLYFFSYLTWDRTVNLTSIDINWEEPTLSYVANRSTNYPQTYNLIEIPKLGTVSLLDLDTGN